MLHLIPAPKKLVYGKEEFRLYELENIRLPADCPASILRAAVSLADDFEKVTGKRLRFAKSVPDGKSVTVEFSAAVATASYRISAGENGFTVSAAAETELFYALQTMRQIVNSCGNVYSSMEIEDAPDFAHRGVYHDITRGAVPTLKSLFELADLMAYYKLNQLQLYVEHTFAFARHCDIWEGSDPITAEEILRLDAYCKERHIELVPSLSTFGHFYMALRSKRKEDLNELDIKASEIPFSFYDRMAHYTLNCSDPRSIELVADMLAEFIPLFSSDYFNICCDETFDLGKGKNRAKADELGTETLYVEFLKKIIAIVGKAGKTAMFWGDIIAAQPELIRTLPENTIALEWDYGAKADFRDTAALAKVTSNFYICPGTTVWNCWSADIHVCQQNILNYARKGKAAGAVGLLNTNWGDMGNVNLFANSLYGIIYGAAAAWNTDAAADLERFETAFDRMEFNCTGLSALWRKFGETKIIRWKAVANLVDIAENPWQDEAFQAVNAASLKDAIGKLEDIFTDIMKIAGSAQSKDPLALKELIFGFEMSIMLHRIALAVYEPENKIQAWKTADDLRKMEQRNSPLWHNRFKPSEYYRVRDVLLKVAGLLDKN
ncbi:MAG: hypothetical protein E7058_10040 [Lentisphaerae bacterium]|nr:hypothetical protein [Lentisphaerota bacterium]